MQQDLVRMNVPVVVVQSEYEEFIKREHAKYIVESLPNGEFLLFAGCQSLRSAAAAGTV